MRSRADLFSACTLLVLLPRSFWKACRFRQTPESESNHPTFPTSFEIVFLFLFFFFLWLSEVAAPCGRPSGWTPDPDLRGPAGLQPAEARRDTTSPPGLEEPQRTGLRRVEPPPACVVWQKDRRQSLSDRTREKVCFKFSLFFFFTSLHSCHKRYPTCHGPRPPGGPVSACLQATGPCPSWLSQISLWCHKLAAWTPTLSGTPAREQQQTNKQGLCDLD